MKNTSLTYLVETLRLCFAEVDSVAPFTMGRSRVRVNAEAVPEVA